MPIINNVKSVSVPSFGKLPLADKAGTFTPSGKKREHKPGREAGDGGYTESNVGAKLELNLNLLGGIDVQRLNAIKDENVTVRLADGKVHMMSMAFVTDPIPLDGGESKMTIMSNISEPM